MSAVMERLSERLSELGITVSYDRRLMIFRVQGSDFMKLREVRKYIVTEPEILTELAKQAGCQWKEDRGDISEYQEALMYEAVCAPMTDEEYWQHEFWTERQAMRYADGLPDDFHSTWEACKGAV